jgi:hypothetical protein
MATVTVPAKAPRKTYKKAKTLYKEFMLAKSEKTFLKHLPKIAEVACMKALEGDISAMKLVLDRLVPVQKPTDGSKDPSGSNKAINIIINGSATISPTAENHEDSPVEGEFKEIDEDEQGESDGGSEEHGGRNGD